jgi:ABC-type sugar transport system permease subunit
MAFHFTMAFGIPCFQRHSVVPMVASSILWIWILNPQIGIINTLLAQ